MGANSDNGKTVFTQTRSHDGKAKKNKEILMLAKPRQAKVTKKQEQHDTAGLYVSSLDSTKSTRRVRAAQKAAGRQHELPVSISCSRTIVFPKQRHPSASGRSVSQMV